nr:MAG TPA: hypothetical protein [Caudoviricetes sp.]
MIRHLFQLGDANETTTKAQSWPACFRLIVLKVHTTPSKNTTQTH